MVSAPKSSRRADAPWPGNAWCRHGACGFGAVVLAGLVVWSNMSLAQEGQRRFRFDYRLEAEGPASAKSAKVKFTLTNRSAESARVALHNTPLRGEIATRMFRVTCLVNDREEPREYRGMLRSSDKPSGPADAEPQVAPQGKVQGAEALKDAVLINPGESRSAVVDLVPSYRLPETGQCKVAFTAVLNIVDLDGGFGGQPKYSFVEPEGEPLVLELTSSNG